MKAAPKFSRQLPSRGALNDLGRSQRTINDYSKTTPLNPTTPQPAAILGLAKPKLRR